MHKTNHGDIRLTNKPSIDQLITFLYVNDLENSTQFYQSVLSFPLALDQGTCRIFHVTSHSFLGICQAQSTIIPSKDITLTLVTENVDTWFEKLSLNNVPVDGKPRLNPEFHIYHFYITDPDGYRIEIQRFTHPFDASI